MPGLELVWKALIIVIVTLIPGLMESVLTSLECRVEAFISGNPQFLKSTSEIWDSLERNGKISQEDASRATSILFDLLARQLDGLGIPVSRPLKQEVAVLLQSLHVDNAAGLDESQFRVRVCL